MNLDWNLGFGVKLGVIPTPTTLLFLQTGPDWAFLHETSQLNSFTGYSFTQRNFSKLGWELGLGVEHLFYDQWFLKGMIDYRWYPKISVSGFGIHDPGLVSAIFSVGYKFPLKAKF